MDEPEPHREVLVIFARHPEPGRVKTRLARTLGAATAAALYEAFLVDLRTRFAAPSFAVRWAVAPPGAGFAARLGLAPEVVFEQRGGDLGERLHHAFVTMRGEGFRRCAVVGSDMPQLAPAAVEEAFGALAGAELALGPAEDGGYYLIAAGDPPDVFSGVPWGSDAVLRATLARAAEGGLRVALLEHGFDVDVEADVDRLRSWIEANGAARALPATAAALERIGRPMGTD